ncbi:hypothetical protein [Hyphomicrobium sp.]|uniref:hypothetical protein n=1 Tax=Hyphomicrobium sp. TaxID=82 RepID=UPI001D802A02|nr:hypothetical protein [Hyphomicrobium sp.]MBY0561462.1 hypothetical protein [Hyphomicrobium sp.]
MTAETYPHNRAARAQLRFDLQRFEKLCGMLASPAEGERATAALMASEMLKSAGLTWSDIVSHTETFVALVQPVKRATETFENPYSKPQKASNTFWENGRKAPPKSRSRAGRSFEQSRPIYNLEAEDRRHPLGPDGNPRFRTWAGVIAFDVVMGVFNRHPPLSPWEASFMSNLEAKALAGRPNQFGVTQSQWKSLLAIATRLGIIRQVSIVPERYELIEEDDA